jgi:hypothetical protein
MAGINQRGLGELINGSDGFVISGWREELSIEAKTVGLLSGGR